MAQRWFYLLSVQKETHFLDMETISRHSSLQNYFIKYNL